MPVSFDVLVIGGGVIGTAIAARLSQTNLSVALVEQSGDIAEGASKGNAGIASSYYSPPDTLDARLMSASVFRWDGVCRRLNVPYRRIGALMPALNAAEAKNLPGLCQEAVGCGVRAAILDGDEARRLEPMISPDCQSALHLPDEGIIDPMRLTWAFAELAAHNGATIRFNAPAIGFRSGDGRIIEAVTPQGAIGVRAVINAAGLHADVISRLAGGEEFRMWPRKGQYWILDREFGARLKHIVFAAPAAETKGIHVVPTTRGSVLLGPTVEECDDRDDKATSLATLEHALAQARRLVPSVSLDNAIKTYAALRPASEEPFFVRADRRVPNLYHAVSRSIGVSTSLGIADYVLELLSGAGMEVEENPSAVQAIPAAPILRHTPDPPSAARGKHAQIMCVCEQVTAAEIEAALAARVPARSLDGVWKRTGAMGGRCQGSACMAGILFMCSVHMNTRPEDVPHKDNGTIGIGHGARR